MLRVVRHQDGSIVGVTNDGEATHLDKAGVTIHTLDHSKLCADICAALGIDPLTNHANTSRITMPIGSFRHNSTRHPVFLILCAEEDEFLNYLHRLLEPESVPSIVLVPTPRLIAGRSHRTIKEAGICLVALSDVLHLNRNGRFVSTTGQGVSMLQASQIASGVAPRKDGVYPPNTVVWKGVEHRCDLTRREMDFLRCGLSNPEIDINTLMHRTSGLLWKSNYSKTKQQRDKVSAFLSRLSGKLYDASPRLNFHFSLVRDRDYVIRNDPVDPATPADSRLTIR